MTTKRAIVGMVLFAALRLAVLPVSGQALTSADDFKQMLKARYDQQKLGIAINGIQAGEYKKGTLGLGPSDAGLVINHYAPGLEIPNRQKGKSGAFTLVKKKSSDADQIDERTFMMLESGLNLSELQRGEIVKCNKFYVQPDRIEMYLVTTGIKHMKDLDMNKASKTVTTSRSGNNVNQTVRVGEFGLCLRFYFDKDSVIKANNYAEVVKEIDKYLLPEADLAKLLDSEKNFEVNNGMAEADVRKVLGEPSKSPTINGQKYLYYKDMIVVVKDGVVTDVKVN